MREQECAKVFQFTVDGVFSHNELRTIEYGVVKARNPCVESALHLLQLI